jgi:putative Mg2+ transporter-C (MgtC) family protein
VFATILVLLVLEAVGALETAANLKLHSRIYEVRGQDADAMYLSVLRVMDEEKRRLEGVERDTLPGMTRLSFTVMATQRGHRKLAELLKRAAGVAQVMTYRTWEEE